jgi:RimJ/RimL family protein N-acetyltransferase
LWKVNLREDGAFIGWVLVRPMEYYSDAPEFDNLEIGWRFKRVAWGKGYATEAAAAVKRALADIATRENTGVKFLSAIAEKDNTGSINIMKKLGMEYVKTYDYEAPTGVLPVEYYQMLLNA